MTGSKHFLLSATIALCATSAIKAQDLRLFEEPERDPADLAAPAPDQNFMVPGNGQPAYTLRSVSRFGSQYQAVLIDRSGQTVKVNWNEGETAPLPNSGFNVVAAGSASSVSLLHPAGDTCINSALVGVSCSAPNRSELQLAPAAPLASNGAASAFVGPQQGAPGFFDNSANAPLGQAQGFVENGVFAPGVDPAQGGQQVFINPFSGEPEVMPQISPEEQAARQQRQDLRAARLRQFDQQQRVDDADIPAGMQRVRTPFGDRLMPIRE
jgi:hypothetical protein